MRPVAVGRRQQLPPSSAFGRNDAASTARGGVVAASVMTSSPWSMGGVKDDDVRARLEEPVDGYGACGVLASALPQSVVQYIAYWAQLAAEEAAAAAASSTVSLSGVVGVASGAGVMSAGVGVSVPTSAAAASGVTASGTGTSAAAAAAATASAAAAANAASKGGSGMELLRVEPPGYAVDEPAEDYVISDESDYEVENAAGAQVAEEEEHDVQDTIEKIFERRDVWGQLTRRQAKTRNEWWRSGSWSPDRCAKCVSVGLWSLFGRTGSEQGPSGR